MNKPTADLQAMLEGIDSTLPTDASAELPDALYVIPLAVLGHGILSEDIDLSQRARSWLRTIPLASLRPALAELEHEAREDWRDDEWSRSRLGDAEAVRTAVCWAALRRHVTPRYVPGFLELSEAMGEARERLGWPIHGDGSTASDAR